VKTRSVKTGPPPPTKGERDTSSANHNPPSPKLPPLKDPVPDMRSKVICKDVAKGYMPWYNLRGQLNVFNLIVGPLLGWAAYSLLKSSQDPQTMADLQAATAVLQSQARYILVAILLIVLAVTFYLSRRDVPVYMVDFSVFVPEDQLKITKEIFRKLSQDSGWFNESSIAFQERLLARNGLGEHTYFPPAIMQSETQVPTLDMAGARDEYELVVYTALDDLFEKTAISPKDVDILVINCSLFCPTPSLAAMVINKYGMRPDIQAYNLGGMGCSAGLISLHLAKDLLQRYRGANALVVSTENITQNWYNGDEKSMMLSNTIFRMGGSAVMLTNKRKYAKTAKYALQHTVRVHKGAKDDMYSCIFQKEDKEGKVGVSLSRDIMTVAGRALTQNMTLVAPVILPASEHKRWIRNLCLRTAHNYFDRVVLGIKGNRKKKGETEQSEEPSDKPEAMDKLDLTATAEQSAPPAPPALDPTANPVGNWLQVCMSLLPALLFLTPIKLPKAACKLWSKTIGPRVGSYTPDFKTCISHWCIHAGGRAVIDAMQTNLTLSEYDVEPSRRTLERFGNTSSSSVWYEMAFIEQTGRIKPGEQVFQISFGSGFKCNSAVWKAINVGTPNGRKPTFFPVADLLPEMLGA